LIEKKLRASVLPNCPPEFLALTLKCCKWEWEKRPQFRQILRILEDLSGKISQGHEPKDEISKIPVMPVMHEHAKLQLSFIEHPMKWKKAMGGREKFLIDTSKLQLLQIHNVEKLNDALHHVLSHSSFSGWLLVGYISERELGLQSYGTGDLEELKTYFRDDETQYALLRVHMGAHKTRDVLIFWMGKDVSLFQRGIKKSHEGEVKLIIKPVHAEIYVNNRKNLTLDNLLEKSHPLSGSHVID